MSAGSSPLPVADCPPRGISVYSMQFIETSCFCGIAGLGCSPSGVCLRGLFCGWYRSSVERSRRSWVLSLLGSLLDLLSSLENPDSGPRYGASDGCPHLDSGIRHRGDVDMARTAGRFSVARNALLTLGADHPDDPWIVVGWSRSLRHADHRFDVGFRCRHCGPGLRSIRPGGRGPTISPDHMEGSPCIGRIPWAGFCLRFVRWRQPWRRRGVPVL